MLGLSWNIESFHNDFGLALGLCGTIMRLTVVGGAFLIALVAGDVEDGALVTRSGEKLQS